MKKEKRSEVRWPAPRPWTKPIEKMTLADDRPKKIPSEVDLPPEHIEEILSPSWAWRMLHKN